MERFHKFVANTVFVFQVLIVFILLVEDRVTVPAWLQLVGRLHPLMLHFPIGLLLFTALLFFTRRYFFSTENDSLIGFLLDLTSLTASLSAFMGLLLSKEGGYDANGLFWHKWLGIAVSFLCWLLVIARDKPQILKPALLVSVIVLIAAGHLGANLTHGENFVLGPIQGPELKTRVITDSTTVFEAAIEPIFEAKCASCHNEQKAKGHLVLTSMEGISKGGKNGPLWHSGDTTHSLIVERLSLPIAAKEHMPPGDKAQLTADEIGFIRQWIAAGADTQTRIADLAGRDSLKTAVSAIIGRYQAGAPDQPKYTFSFASQERVHELSTPYRTVFQIARSEPALQADFYLSGSFQKKHLEELKEVRTQLVNINLSKMPVTDADLETIAAFNNLEKLVLNNTPISGEKLDELLKLDHLTSLSLSGTKVTAEKLALLGKHKSLKEVYVWNTPVTPAEATLLSKQFRNIHWDTGYHADTGEMLKLSPPMLRNDGQVLKKGENIVLKHNLPGTVIRYALNNEEIDSVRGNVYDKPLDAGSYAVVKTKAFKDGWLSSNKAEFVFFRNGIGPARAELMTDPDKKYPGDGAMTLMDGKVGLPDFYRDPSWMAFRETPLEACFYFEGDHVPVSNVTLSYARNIGSLCMPPASLEVWGGDTPKDLKLLKCVTPVQPAEWLSTRIEGTSVDIPPANYGVLKIVARPLEKLPAFRKEKQKGWLMVDEVFFN